MHPHRGGAATASDTPPLLLHQAERSGRDSRLLTDRQALVEPRRDAGGLHLFLGGGYVVRSPVESHLQGFCVSFCLALVLTAHLRIGNSPFVCILGMQRYAPLPLLTWYNSNDL